jgi:transcriptional regulator with XRE-family HTH domain
LRRDTRPGNRLKKARVIMGLTQAELCERLAGTTQSALSDLERGRYQNPNLETARRFADFYGCTIEDLFPAQGSPLREEAEVQPHQADADKVRAVLWHHRTVLECRVPR